jgi:hypothetical protein
MKRIIALTLIMLALIANLCSCTEACDRTCKDIGSNYNGGLYRTVKVYDINGNLIAEYEGKFDVETDNESYILWDDELGKRHIIYYTTFNVIIDEK